MLRTFRWVTVLVLAGVIALASASPALAVGPRLSVRVSEPFEVAGRIYPAGSLSLRTIVDYNPSTAMDEVWIGNECLGLLLAERSLNGRPSDQDTVTFERNHEGRLVLVGYVLRGDGKDNVYRYRATPTHAGNHGVTTADLIAAR